MAALRSLVLLLTAVGLIACGDARPLNEAALPLPDAGSGGATGGSGGTGGAAGGENADADLPIPPGGICAPGATRCRDGHLQTCQADAQSYLVESCPEAAVCEGDRCVEKDCPPNGARCTADGATQHCPADGSAWEAPILCADGLACVEGACLHPLCSPGETACGSKVRLVCADDGLSWTRTPCEAGTRCIDGDCRTDVAQGDCPPGEILCGPDGVRICNAAGDGWEAQPCAENQACFEGRCVDCVRNENCAAGEVCTDGACVAEPVHILTEQLPAGQVGAPYAGVVEATGGTPPYTFTLSAGRLPAGLALEPDGHLDGTPDAATPANGGAQLVVTVMDAGGGMDTHRYTLRILEAGAGLEIVTDSPLPDAEEGSPYDVTFQAVGGQAPYGFFLIGGALPAGLVLDGTGHLAGTPTEVGPFHFTLRAVDAATPPGFAQKDFDLQVTVAPLEIYGDQELNLFVTKLITLPLIAIVPGIPLPYDTQLKARGGLVPYTWTEQPLPAAVAAFVPQSGIPDGLVLDADGHLHGSVADTSQVIDVTIPFTQIRLTGFFFMAQVDDSQNPAATAQAIYIIPTLPPAAPASAP